MRCKLERFYSYHFQPPFGANNRYIVMVRGTVASREAAMALHNPIIAGALVGTRQAGNLSHEVYFRYTPPGEPESLEFLAIDVWIDPVGMASYYQNPDLQAAFGQLFTAPPTVTTWMQSMGTWTE